METSEHRPRRGQTDRGERDRDGGTPSTVEVLARGLLAGAVGVAAMTVAEKLEQAVTKRPNSYLPAHTMEALLGVPGKPDRERLWMNCVLHSGCPVCRDLD